MFMPGRGRVARSTRSCSWSTAVLKSVSPKSGAGTDLEADISEHRFFRIKTKSDAIENDIGRSACGQLNLITTDRLFRSIQYFLNPSDGHRRLTRLAELLTQLPDRPDQHVCIADKRKKSSDGNNPTRRQIATTDQHKAVLGQTEQVG